MTDPSREYDHAYARRPASIDRRNRSHLGHKTQYVYDADNNRTKIIDKNGRETAFTYDGQGNVLSRTDAKKGVTTLKYNALNDPDAYC